MTLSAKAFLLSALTLGLAAQPAQLFAQASGSQAADATTNLAKAITALKKAKPAFEAASVIVIGRTPHSNDTAQWVSLMAKPDYGLKAEVDQGVTFPQAVNFLKAYIARPDGAALRAEAINNAFDEVYGRPSTATEQALWDARVRARQAWFAPIVIGEQAKLAASPALQQQVFTLAVARALGRPPSQGEAARAPRADYEHLINFERNHLYSSDGAGELVATITRALAAKGQSPTDGAIKAAMVKFTPSRAIYSEMIRPSLALFKK